MSNKQWHGGKGSTERPIADREHFKSEYDRIFYADKEKKESEKLSKDKKNTE